MTMMVWGLIASIMAASSVQTENPTSSFLTGVELTDLCNTFGRQDWKEGVCKGIILGTMMRAQVRFCLPESNSPDALYDGVLRFVAAHPERLHFPLPQVIDEALAAKFPCSGA